MSSTTYKAAMDGYADDPQRKQMLLHGFVCGAGCDRLCGLHGSKCVSSGTARPPMAWDAAEESALQASRNSVRLMLRWRNRTTSKPSVHETLVDQVITQDVVDDWLVYGEVVRDLMEGNLCPE